MTMSDYVHRVRDKVGHDLLHLPSVTVIAFDAQGRVLLVKHADTKVWVAPGGSVDPDESPADAAVREMWEETGLLVEPTCVLGVYGGPECHVTYPNGDQVSYLMTVFGCADSLMLRKAHAYALLQSRGHKLPSLEELRTLTS